MRAEPETHGPTTTRAYEAGAAAPLSCVPNLDGDDRRDRARARRSGVPVKFLVSPPGESRTVDLDGHADASGQLVWDFGTDYADDQVACTSQAVAARGQVVRVVVPRRAVRRRRSTRRDTLEAVYSQDDNGLYSRASRRRSRARRRRDALRLRHAGHALQASPSGRARRGPRRAPSRTGCSTACPYAGTGHLPGTDDATGQLILPDFTFTQAHRVAHRRHDGRPSAGENVVTRQVSFLFECFGEVARATSQPNETNDDFTTAAEVRRLRSSDR